MAYVLRVGVWCTNSNLLGTVFDPNNKPCPASVQRGSCRRCGGCVSRGSCRTGAHVAGAADVSAGAHVAPGLMTPLLNRGSFRTGDAHVALPCPRWQADLCLRGKEIWPSYNKFYHVV